MPGTLFGDRRFLAGGMIFIIIFLAVCCVAIFHRFQSLRKSAASAKALDRQMREDLCISSVKMGIKRYYVDAISRANPHYPLKLDDAAMGSATPNNRFFYFVLSYGLEDLSWFKTGRNAYKSPSGRALYYDREYGIFDLPLSDSERAEKILEFIRGKALREDEKAIPEDFREKTSYRYELLWRIKSIGEKMRWLNDKSLDAGIAGMRSAADSVLKELEEQAARTDEALFAQAPSLPPGYMLNNSSDLFAEAVTARTLAALSEEELSGMSANIAGLFDASQIALLNDNQIKALGAKNLSSAAFASLTPAQIRLVDPKEDVARWRPDMIISLKPETLAGMNKDQLDAISAILLKYPDQEILFLLTAAQADILNLRPPRPPEPAKS